MLDISLEQNFLQSDDSNKPMINNLVSAGQVLLAEPFMADPNFKRTALLLCEHSNEGSIGFIMNKPLSMNITELLDQFPDFESEVHFGGPVQTDTIHYLHAAGDLIEDSVRVADGVFWGGDFDKLKFLIRTELIHPKDIRFFVGYSGWGEGQLKDELSYGSWVIADMHANYLFKSKPKELWKKVMANKGDTFSVIAELPEPIIWN